MTRALACLAALLLAAPAFAQEQAHYAPVAADTDVSVDHASDQDGNTSSNVLFDSVVSVRLGRHLEAITRPYLQRNGATGEWNWQVWVAEARYERPGTVGLRIEGGLIPSPVGYANLLLRPHLNPTIALPSSLFQPLPSMQPGGPRATLLGAVYATGGSVTLSGTHWDARGALIDTSPLRTRRIFAYDFNNPPRFANVVIGGGLTPWVGFRVGASVTHGGWLKAGETPTVTADRAATIVTIESEFSYGYTKVAGEWTHDSVQTTIGTPVASGWFVQGQQTLTPRWFAAARVERMAAPVVGGPQLSVPLRFYGTEEVVGYRVNREITLRAGHRARETFGRDTFVHAFEVSVVWSKRWL